MKFRSLMFRELRLSRKFIILQFVLQFAWMALIWGMLFSLDASEVTPEEQSAMVDTVILMNALIGAMSLLIDESFKADVNSGWLNYSYALTITPVERTASRFVRRFSAVCVCELLSLCNAAAICVYMRKVFGVNFIVWHTLILSAVILISLPNEILCSCPS